MTPAIRQALILGLLLAGSALGCVLDDTPPTPAIAAPPPEPTFEERWGARPAASDSRLRILVPTAGEPALLPRTGHPRDFELSLVLEFAESQGLQPLVISLPESRDLIPALQAGWGDVAIGSLTVTPARAEQAAFTRPVTSAREQLVTRSEDLAVAREPDLAGRRLGIRASSSFFQTAAELAQRIPTLAIESLPEELDSEQILYRVATGAIDLTIADSHLVEAVLTYRPDLRVAFDLSQERPQAWATRREDTALLEKLDRFLAINLPGRAPDRFRGDLPDIKRRKALRVLTRNSGATYFVYRGQLLGFEYELAERFAKSQDLYLELVVPPTRSALIPWLKEGRGDLVAASMVQTREREAQGVAFSDAYKSTREVIVSRGDDPIASLDQLVGRTLVVRRSSSYWQTARKLSDSGLDVRVVPAPEDFETEEIIGRVASGEYDLTIADSHIVEIELAWRKNVRVAIPLSDQLGHRWVVRNENPELLSAVNGFLRDEDRSRGILKTLRRYFSSPWRTRRYTRMRASNSGTISPYDAVVQKYAAQYALDWRLIVSQMYQESRFDPEAQSPAGAQGLMQFMPNTARRYGLHDRTHPEHSIRAGVRYMADLRDTEFPEVNPNDRLWFALAAYNAGPGHVMDAQRIADEAGLDPARWFGNVEEGILLLSRREYYRKARFGYCRGSEPFSYVREIRARYEAYLRSTPNIEVSAPPAS